MYDIPKSLTDLITIYLFCFIDFLTEYLILDTNFNIIMTKKHHGTFQILLGVPPPFLCTFRKLRNTPTHPLGTFRLVFHQKSTYYLDLSMKVFNFIIFFVLLFLIFFISYYLLFYFYFILVGK